MREHELMLWKMGPSGSGAPTIRLPVWLFELHRAASLEVWARPRAIRASGGRATGPRSSVLGPAAALRRARLSTAVSPRVIRSTYYVENPSCFE